jgi:hypothetical protein
MNSIVPMAPSSATTPQATAKAQVTTQTLPPEIAIALVLDASPTPQQWFTHFLMYLRRIVTELVIPYNLAKLPSPVVSFNLTVLLDGVLTAFFNANYF